MVPNLGSEEGILECYGVYSLCVKVDKQFHPCKLSMCSRESLVSVPMLGIINLSEHGVTTTFGMIGDSIKTIKSWGLPRFNLCDI